MTKWPKNKIPESKFEFFPFIGFPTMDETDMKTIHEAYQFLSEKYIDDIYTAPNTFALLHKSILKMAYNKPNMQTTVQLGK